MRPVFTVQDPLSDRNSDVVLATLGARVQLALKDLNRAECWAEVVPESKDTLKPLKRPLTSEEARETDPVKNLKSELCLAKLVVEVRKPVTDLNSIFFSASPEAIDNELVNNRISELCSVRLDAELKESTKDLNREVFSEKLEEGLSEALRPLPIPLD